MNELSTVLYQINFRYILDNCLDKRMWRKSWTLFDYDQCILLLKLARINVADNNVVLKVATNENRWRSISFELPMDKAHFNTNVFYTKVFSALRDMIQMEERDLMDDHPLYLEGRKKDNLMNEANRIMAERRLDSLAIVDDEIRELYIEKYVSDNRTDYTYDVVRRLRYTISTTRYLMLAHQFAKLAPDPSTKLLDEINDKFIEGSLDDYTASIKEYLDGIEIQDMAHE